MSEATTQNTTQTTEQSKLQKYINNSDVYSQKQKMLLENYNTQNTRIAQNKRAQQDAAAINYQKLLKYLPQYNASMGLRGSRASEGALLDAQARYRSQQGQIAATYDAQSEDAAQAYNQNLLNLYAEADAAQKQEQADTYGLAYDAISSWEGSSEDLSKYYDKIKNKLSEEQLLNLNVTYQEKLTAAQNREKNDAIQADDGWKDMIQNGNVTVTPPKSYKEGKNFSALIDGVTFDVQVGQQVSNAGAQLAADNGGYEAGDLMLYNGVLYLVGENMSTYTDGEGNTVITRKALYEIENRGGKEKGDSGYLEEYAGIALKKKLKG